jgi:hypothetical protein
MSATSSASPSSSATATISPEQFAIRAAETNLPFILGLTTTFFALALIAVILRTYVRIALVKVMGRDDYTMIAAMVRLVTSATRMPFNACWLDGLVLSS